MSFVADVEEYGPLLEPLVKGLVSALKEKRVSPEFVTQLTKLVVIEASDQIVKDEIAKHQ